MIYRFSLAMNCINMVIDVKESNIFVVYAFLMQHNTKNALALTLLMKMITNNQGLQTYTNSILK